MKFADKIIWSCLITLAVLFSIGSTLMIYTNHEQLLRSTIQIRLYDHDIEINALTSKVFRDTLEDTTEFGQDAQLVQERIIYYLQQFQDSGDLIRPGLHAYNDNIMRQALDVVKAYVPSAELRGI